MSQNKPVIKKFLELKSLSGSQYKLQNHRKIYKLTTQNGIHYGFQFQKGLNQDPIALTLHQYTPGGFCCTFEDCFYQWVDYQILPMYYIWEVEIPDWAEVVEFPNSTVLKTSAFYLINPQPISSMPQWNDPNWQIKSLLHSTHNLQYFPKASLRVLKTAMILNGLAIQHLVDPPEILQLLAVDDEGTAIKYLKNPSIKVQISAIKDTPWALADGDISETTRDALLKANPKCYPYLEQRRLGLPLEIISE